jgi:hypothetical protein
MEPIELQRFALGGSSGADELLTVNMRDVKKIERST